MRIVDQRSAIGIVYQRSATGVVDSRVSCKHDFYRGIDEFVFQRNF